MSSSNYQLVVRIAIEENRLINFSKISRSRPRPVFHTNSRNRRFSEEIEFLCRVQDPGRHVTRTAGDTCEEDASVINRDCRTLGVARMILEFHRKHFSTYCVTTAQARNEHYRQSVRRDAQTFRFQFSISLAVRRSNSPPAPT